MIVGSARSGRFYQGHRACADVFVVAGAEALTDIGAVPDYTTPAQYTAFIQNEIAKFGEIVAKEKQQMDVN